VITRGLLRRALWVMGRLRSGAPLKATLLAREFEVSLRTAYRDDTRDPATCTFSSGNETENDGPVVCDKNTAVGGGAMPRIGQMLEYTADPALPPVPPSCR